MTDNGKKAMMQLGYTISKNWKPIQNGFNKVWNRVQQNFPETAKKLTATLNLAMSEGAAETASSFIINDVDEGLGKIASRNRR